MAYDYYKTGEGEKPELSEKDCKELISIVDSSANDVGSKMSFSTINNGNGVVNNTFFISSTEANAIQNRLKKDCEELKTVEEHEKIHRSQLLKFFQVRGDMNSKVGNKASIDVLHDKYLNVVFENDEIKDEMLHSEMNPLTTGFLVDVIVQTIKNSPTAYKIVKLHDMFSLED